MKTWFVKEVNDHIVRKISKKPNLTILLALKDGTKRWSDLEKLLNKKYVHQGLKELFDLGLIQATIIHDSPIGTKAYELTELGKKIVEYLDKMEKEFVEYHSKIPKEPDKFLKLDD